jgi:hypothetical protein
MLESKLFRSIHNHLSDCNHITWFRNFASVSLLATLSHKTWIANDFSSFQLFQKRSKISDCIFWKFSYKQKFSFLLISCSRNEHSTMIENYIRKNDEIKCEVNLALIEKLINLALIEKLIHYLTFTDADKLLLSRKTLIDSHRLLSRDVLLRE